MTTSESIRIANWNALLAGGASAPECMVARIYGSVVRNSDERRNALRHAAIGVDPVRSPGLDDPHRISVARVLSGLDPHEHSTEN